MMGVRLPTVHGGRMIGTYWQQAARIAAPYARASLI